MKQEGTRWVSVCLGLVATGFVVWPGASEAADKMIDLSVVSTDGGYKLQFTNSECPDRPDEKGCIRAEHGNSPMLQWELESASNQYWMLTRLQFSPDGVNWGDNAYPLADCTMKAFALEGPDRYSGNASSASVTGNGRKLQVRDGNGEPCQTHYRIYAMPRVGGAEIDSDPIIDNRGGGTH